MSDLYDGKGHGQKPSLKGLEKYFTRKAHPGTRGELTRVKGKYGSLESSQIRNKVMSVSKGDHFPVPY